MNEKIPDMAVLLYNLVIRCYFAGIRLASFFHQKAGAWVEGRRGVFSILEADLAGRGDAKVVWMHCASLGEFEQGRTVLEALKRKAPGIKILLTFFSPSGFEIRKNYEHADWVHYLPADSATNARRFVEIVRPDLAVFVKYEFWYHYLRQLRRSRAKVILIAAAFRPGQLFFRPYGMLHRRMLDCFDRIFTQDENSVELLAGATRTPAVFAGDPRVDRVLEIAQQDRYFSLVKKFCGNRPVLVGGSTWPEDEALIFSVKNKPQFSNWKLILAPHDVQAAHLQQIEKKAGARLVRFSAAAHLTEKDLENAEILLIDSVGMLAWLYRYGRVAYIGGGFGAGIHNTLEAVAFGLPVIFGPRFGKFPEAVFLVKNGGGFTIKNEAELQRTLADLTDRECYAEAAGRAADYIRQNRGATDKIAGFVLESGILEK